jgi:hypothetical protein
LEYGRRFPNNSSNIFLKSSFSCASGASGGLAASRKSNERVSALKMSCMHGLSGSEAPWKWFK